MFSKSRSSGEEKKITDETKTLFHEKAEEYQKSQDRTKEQGIKTALGVLGISLAAVVGGTVLYFLMGSICGRVLCILPLVIIGGAIGTVVGLIWTIVNFVRPTKLVTCPNCSTEHRIYRAVRKYMCIACRALLLMGRTPRLTPRLFSCPYCGLQTAVSDDHGRFLCPNCGIVRQPSGTHIGETKTCPTCERTVPKEAIYCKFCGNILKSDFDESLEGDPSLAYDEDWKIGKDATGHFYFAKALFKSIRERINAAEKTQSLPSVAKLSVAEVQSLLSKLADALMSLEEALRKSELRSSIEVILPEVDLIYADLLNSELRGIQARKNFGKDELKVLATEPHITARERIENIFADSLESSGSIGKWNGKLVDVIEGEKDSQISGYQRLVAEVDRFTKWRAERGEGSG